MNDNVFAHTASAADRRLAVSAAIAFAGLIGTILTLAFSTDPTGHQLQMTVTAFGVAIAVAMASVVGAARRPH